MIDQPPKVLFLVISFQRDFISNTLWHVLILLAIIVESFQMSKKISASKLRLDFFQMTPGAVAVFN